MRQRPRGAGTGLAAWRPAPRRAPAEDEGGVSSRSAGATPRPPQHGTGVPGDTSARRRERRKFITGFAHDLSLFERKLAI